MDFSSIARFVLLGLLSLFGVKDNPTTSSSPSTEYQTAKLDISVTHEPILYYSKDSEFMKPDITSKDDLEDGNSTKPNTTVGTTEVTTLTNATTEVTTTTNDTTETTEITTITNGTTETTEITTITNGTTETTEITTVTNGTTETTTITNGTTETTTITNGTTETTEVTTVTNGTTETETTPTVTVMTTTPVVTTAEPKKHKLSKGAVAGIVIGVMGVIAVIAGGVFVLMKRRQTIEADKRRLME